MADEHGLDFGGTEPFSSNFGRVVRATENVPETIFVHGSPIAVDPNIGEPAPISLKIPLRIFPEAARHADPRLPHDELADLSAHRHSIFIDDIGGNARHRSRKSTGLERRENVTADQTP